MHLLLETFPKSKILLSLKSYVIILINKNKIGLNISLGYDKINIKSHNRDRVRSYYERNIAIYYRSVYKEVHTVYLYLRGVVL